MNIQSTYLVPDKPIAFNRDFVRLGIGVSGALMLSQAVYWGKRTRDPDGWFYKTMVEWEEETGLTRTEQETARKKLRSVGIFEEERRSVPAKLYFRVNVEKLVSLLLQTSMQESRKLEAVNPADKSAEIPQTSYTENTSESTTESSPALFADGDVSFDDWIEEKFSEFWKIYPNRKNKKKAHDTFERILKRRKEKQAFELVSVIFEGLKKAIDSAEWKEKNGRFVPHPTTWLNGERWDDELTSESTSTVGSGAISL